MCRLLLPPEHSSSECGSAVKQETAKNQTTPGTTSVSTNRTNWKMIRAKRFFSFSDFSVKIMKQMGWQEGAFSYFALSVSIPVDLLQPCRSQVNQLKTMVRCQVIPLSVSLCYHQGKHLFFHSPF